jgi:hypothetical protein
LSKEIHLNSLNGKGGGDATIPLAIDAAEKAAL